MGFNSAFKGLIMVVELTCTHFVEDIRIQSCREDFTTLKPGAVSHCALYSVGSMCMYSTHYHWSYWLWRKWG